jgi:hypothetical protein
MRNPIRRKNAVSVTGSEIKLGRMQGTRPLAAAILLAGAASGFAQDNLAVFFVDSAIGYLGGGTGINSASPGTTLSKTLDGGASWSPQTSGAANSIHALCFLNADTR